MDTFGGLARSQPASASERVYQFVKAEILSRRIEAHEVLSEGQIALSVGVSRTPVREALLRLEAEGLLRLLPKRGALVLPVTTEQMLDLIETRRVVETFAVRKVLGGGRPGASTKLAAALERHLEVMRRALDKSANSAGPDVAAYVTADRDFHAEIVAAADNTILVDLYRTLRDRQLRMGSVNLLDESAQADLPRMRATLADHELIAAAIAGRRLRVAESAITNHLGNAERLLRAR